MDCNIFGTPKGIRTPVAGMKTQYPRPLDDGGKQWLGWLDSNQRMQESKSCALPLGDIPTINSGSDLLSHRATPAVQSALEDLTAVFEMRTGVTPPQLSPELMGWIMGFEPTASGATILRSNQLSYIHHIYLIFKMKWHA